MITTWRGVLVTASVFGALGIALIFVVVGMSPLGWALFAVPPLIGFASFLLLGKFVQRTRLRIACQAAVWILLFAATLVCLLLI